MNASAHWKWASAASAVAIVVGLSSYYAGWKVNVQQSAVKEFQIDKVLREHDPLMVRVSEQATMNDMQQARINALESSVGALVVKMDRLTDLLVEQHEQEKRRRLNP